MLEVRWDLMKKGPLGRVQQGLRMAIGQHIRHNKTVYVGMTVDPKRRATQHSVIFLEEYGWSSLIVLWKTTSRSKAFEAENILIQQARRNAVNVKSGGGYPAEGPYYIYVIV